jgi:hypothetical protein
MSDEMERLLAELGPGGDAEPETSPNPFYVAGYFGWCKGCGERPEHCDCEGEAALRAELFATNAERDRLLAEHNDLTTTREILRCMTEQRDRLLAERDELRTELIAVTTARDEAYRRYVSD